MDIRPAQICPSCGDRLQIDRLRCNCGVVVEGQMRWPRLARLGVDEQQLIELLILAGASLKDVAKQLNISYPTLRKRLDTLIQHLEEEVKKDADWRLHLLREAGSDTQSADKAAKEMENP